MMTRTRTIVQYTVSMPLSDLNTGPSNYQNNYPQNLGTIFPRQVTSNDNLITKSDAQRYCSIHFIRTVHLYNSIYMTRLFILNYDAIDSSPLI